MLVHLLLLQMDHTLSFFLVVLKLPMLSMFLKFEIEGSFARRGRRVVCGDQTGLLGQRELLLGRLRDAGRAARALV